MPAKQPARQPENQSPQAPADGPEGRPGTQAAAPPGTGCFVGLRVIELGRVFSGPLCGMFLADLGAQVIKVERPGSGDESRQFGADSQDGQSSYFNALNRSKLSLALDLADPADKAAFLELVATADVLVHNWVQDSLDRLGCSWPALQALNPRLVYCSISGMGYHSPWRQQPSQDIVAQAMSGLLSLTGEPDGPPQRSGIPVVDYATGMHAAFGIMAALYQREHTGQGQLVHTSLLESALAMTSFAAASWLAGGPDPWRNGNRHPSISPYNLYRTKDCHVCLAVANQDMWLRLCTALDLPELASDPDFATNTGRLARRDRLEAILEARLAGFGGDELLSLLQAHRVSCTRVHSVAQAWSLPEVQALDLAVRCTGPGDQPGPQVVGSPVHLSNNPPSPPSPPPALDNGRSRLATFRTKRSGA